MTHASSSNNRKTRQTTSTHSPPPHTERTPHSEPPSPLAHKIGRTVIGMTGRHPLAKIGYGAWHAVGGRSGNAEAKVLITTTGRPTATKREPDYNRDTQHDRHIDRPEPPSHHDWPDYRPPPRRLFRPASAGRVQAGHRLLVKGHAQGTEQLVELRDRTGSDDRDDGRPAGQQPGQHDL